MLADFSKCRSWKFILFVPSIPKDIVLKLQQALQLCQYYEDARVEEKKNWLAVLWIFMYTDVKICWFFFLINHCEKALQEFHIFVYYYFVDSIRETRRYSKVDATPQVDLHNNPQAEMMVQMKLFRAQRNLYISGFSLFLLM